MKNKLTLTIVLFVLVTISIYLYLQRNREVELTFNPSSENLRKWLYSYSEREGGNYTTDQNIQYLIEKHLLPPKPNPLTAEYIRQKEDLAVPYYDDRVFIGKSGFYTPYFNLYSTEDGEKLNSDCTIIANFGYEKINNVLVSSYPYHTADVFDRQGLCVYVLGEDNFSYIDLSSQLKEKEILQHVYEMYNSESVYQIDETNRTITVSIFDSAKRDEQGIFFSFVRDITVPY